jgi:hypothetical protein
MKCRGHRFGARFVLGLSASILVTGFARAEEPNDEEKARVLFKEGRSLASDGHYDQACPKFEESLKLDAGIGTQFNLADCWEHVGRMKSAQAMFTRAAGAAHEKGQDDREKVLRDRAAALDGKVPKLGIEAQEVADGLEVLVDSEIVDRTNWATGVRVDPGRHAIEARAPHKKSWSLRVDVPASPAMVTITVPKLEDEEKKAAPAPVSKPADEKVPPSAEPRPEPSAKPSTVNHTVKILLLSGAGAGVVLAGIGFAIYKLSNDNAKDVCPASTGCTADDVRRHDGFVDDAATARALGYLGLGVAGAALVGLTVVTLTSPSKREAPHGATVSAAPLVGNGAWGASVRGRF